MNTDEKPVPAPSKQAESNAAAGAARSKTPWEQASEKLLGISKLYRTRASQLRANNPADVEASRLESFADEIDKLGIATEVDLAKQDMQARREDWVKWRQHERDWLTENTRQIIQLASAAIRTVVLINGGALVALLAFLGNVWARSGSVAAFAPAFRWFAAGLIIATVTFALAYAAQYCYGESEGDGDAIPKWLRVGKGFHIAAIVFFIAALGAFGRGCFESFVALRTAAPPPIAAPIQEAQNGRTETADKATTGPGTIADTPSIQQEGHDHRSAPAVATEGPAASVKTTGEEVAPIASEPTQKRQ